MERKTTVYSQEKDICDKVMYLQKINDKKQKLKKKKRKSQSTTNVVANELESNKLLINSRCTILKNI